MDSVPAGGDGAGKIRVVAAVVERRGKYLVCRRPAHKRHADKWEFPGGKVHAGESDSDAIRRELDEELAVDARATADPLVHVAGC